MNRYREAQLFPGSLRGRNTVMKWSELRHRGLPRAGLVARVHRGTYLIGATAPDLLDRARAALTVGPSDAVLGYQTAAALLGFGVAPTADVHLVVPAGQPVPQHPGVVTHESVVPVEPVLALDLPCTPPGRTAVDLARTLARPDALAVLDAALATRACTDHELADEVDIHSGLRGVRQARELLPLADPRPQSRRESQLRLILHDGGVRGLEPQLRVATYRVDLGNPDTRVGVDYDRDGPGDRARRAWLTSNGWRMRSFSDRDIDERPAHIVQVVEAARYQSR
jgi:very-short-patch-repair endonuclease